MSDKIIENNQVTVIGEVVSEFTYSHEVFGEGFYMVELLVKRLSNSCDRIPVMISERLIDVTQDCRGEYLMVSGQFRSYNRHEETKNRLVLSVFAREIEFIEEEPDGASLKVLDKDGNAVESWTSTDKPHYMEKLPIGDYILREETAPEGYLIAEDVEFSVKDTGEIQKVVMKDEVKPEETPTPETPSTQVTDTPKTGDDTHMLIWILLAIAGMAGSVSAVWIAKKRK